MSLDGAQMGLKNTILKNFGNIFEFWPKQKFIFEKNKKKTRAFILAKNIDFVKTLTQSDQYLLCLPWTAQQHHKQT